MVYDRYMIYMFIVRAQMSQQESKVSLRMYLGSKKLTLCDRGGEGLNGFTAVARFLLLGSLGSNHCSSHSTC